MALHPAHCSRAFSTITRSACRAQLNGAVLDRYSTIRRFFRTQALVRPPLAREITLQNYRNGTMLQNGVCERKRWLHSYLKECHSNAATDQVHWYLRARETRPLRGRTIASGLGLNIRLHPGDIRRLHASAACTNSAKGHEQPGQSGNTQSQQDKHSPLGSEGPPISQHDHGRPCTCKNPQAASSPTPPIPPPPQPQQQQPEKLQGQPIDPTNPPKYLEDYSRFFRRLAMSLPHPHRPTRDEFLSIATGFWQRLKIRFKWFTIKSFRKFNADDISAFVTWFLMSQTLWIFVGTTTFFSVVFAIANSLQLQRYVARAISDYLTSETGVTIIFESAIVPKWRESRISFKNVYVSRRPSELSAKALRQRQLEKNEHLTAVGYDVSNHPGYHHLGEDDDDVAVPPIALDEEDANMSLFDLTIDSVDVTLSLWKWLDGRGLVEDAVIRGVRGVLDRRNVFWDPDNPPDPALFRHKSLPGDFELRSLQLEDLLITVYQPGAFRPYTASIFRADIRQFRKRWLFYDFLCAENVVGQFDNCLFSLHKPQSIGRTTEQDLGDGEWVRMSRIRIDGVNVDHLQNSTTMEGPISWITSGKVDAVLDIKFPRDPHDGFTALLGDIADAISTSLSNELKPIPGQRELARPPLSAPEDELYNYTHTRGGSNTSGDGGEEGLKVVIDIDLRFRDLKAAVPIFTNDLSYVNNAFIRPIVAFMNSNRTLVPIHCRTVKNLNDFDGAWTMWETGLMDEISMKTYDALAYHVSQANMNRQRIKTVSIWSLQKTASAVLSALKNIADPVSSHLKEVHLSGQQGLALGLHDTIPVPLGIDL